MFYPVLYNNFRKTVKGFYYTVQAGDNIEKVSKRYKIPIHNLIFANNITYPYTIIEGERLFIPGMDEPIASSGVVVHTVIYGESIDTIALKYGLSPEAIMERNYLSNKNMTFIGQKLLIPQKEEYIEGEVISEKRDTTAKDNDEIRVFPYSPYLPRPGTTSYENIKNVTRKLSVLKRGSRESDVIKFQRLASAIGYKMKKVDGHFGSELENIVRTIQKDAGLEPNGIVNEKVWEYVFSRVNNMPGMMG